MTRTRYLYRRYLGWLPVQFCMVCEKPHWAGLPRPALAWPPRWEWMPRWNDYCSAKCCEEEYTLLDKLASRTAPDAGKEGT